MSMSVINICSARLIAAFQIELVFDDQHRQVVDFRPLLSHSRHPAIRAYLQPELFASFEIRHGEIVWGDYDLCFPITDLYNNNLERFEAMNAAA